MAQITTLNCVVTDPHEGVPTVRGLTEGLIRLEIADLTHFLPSKLSYIGHVIDCCSITEFTSTFIRQCRRFEQLNRYSTFSTTVKHSPKCAPQWSVYLCRIHVLLLFLSRIRKICLSSCGKFVNFDPKEQSVCKCL